MMKKSRHKRHLLPPSVSPIHLPLLEPQSDESDMTDPAAVAQFMSITGADQPTAEFFLSASHGNIDAAVSAFFESDGMVPTASEAPRPHGSRPAPASQRGSSSRSTGRASGSSGFATLGSLATERDEEDEEGYYAGGEKSGQMIQDPRRGDDEGPSSLADAIFQRAQERGPLTEEEREEFEGAQRFSGAGYRLGDQNIRARTRPDVIGSRSVTRVLTFYANGFTVDDGPLRTFDDPENEEFLSDVNKGAVPKEMEEPGVAGVSITLVDKKEEEYEAKKPKVVPFSGGGRRLDGGGGSSANSTVPAGAVDTEGAAAAITVDESRPITSVQVRLSDGTRVVARLNEDNTVGDLRQFVRASRSNVGGFVLSTTFPRKVLDDDGKTIKEAGLKGAVVVQTLK